MPRQIATHVDSGEALGRRLRTAREAAGLSQGRLAFPGCSAGYVSLVESGKRVPSLQVVRELAARVGVPEAWLARGVDEHESGIGAALRDAELALRLDHVDEAEACFRKLGPLARSCSEEARIAAGLGQVAYRRDQLQGAVDFLERALELDPELGDQSATDALGRAYFRLGETEAAIALFRSALARADAANDPAGRLRFGVLLANALTDVGCFSEATELLSRVLEDVQGGDALALARAYWTQARLHIQQEEHESAGRLARKAVDLLELTEHTYFRAKAYHLLAFAELDSGNAEAALELLTEGLALLGDQGTASERGEFHLEMARALALLDRTDEAAALAMRTAAELRDDHPADLGRSYALLAAVLDERGESERALEVYELALELLEEPVSRYFADTCTRYASLLERLGRRAAAFDAYKRAANSRAILERSRITSAHS